MICNKVYESIVYFIHCTLHDSDFIAPKFKLFYHVSTSVAVWDGSQDFAFALLSAWKTHLGVHKKTILLLRVFCVFVFATKGLFTKPGLSALAFCVFWMSNVVIALVSSRWHSPDLFNPLPLTADKGNYFQSICTITRLITVQDKLYPWNPCSATGFSLKITLEKSHKTNCRYFQPSNRKLWQNNQIWSNTSQMFHRQSILAWVKPLILAEKTRLHSKDWKTFLAKDRADVLIQQCRCGWGNMQALHRWD